MVDDVVSEDLIHHLQPVLVLNFLNPATNHGLVLF
jgi:hypothetical protein